MPYALPWREYDRAVAAMLEVEESTARRWRLGLSDVPGPAAMAASLHGQTPDGGNRSLALRPHNPHAGRAQGVGETLCRKRGQVHIEHPRPAIAGEDRGMQDRRDFGVVQFLGVVCAGAMHAGTLAQHLEHIKNTRAGLRRAEWRGLMVTRRSGANGCSAKSCQLPI